MAISRLTGQNAVGASTTTSLTVNYPSTATNNNTLIATVYKNVGVGTGSISGWTMIASQAFSGTAQSVEIWAKISNGTETSVAYTGATGATIVRMHITEYSGLATTITTDGTNGATSATTSVTTITSGNVTTTNADDLLLVAAATGGNSTAQAFDGGFTLQQKDASTIRLFDADQIVAATGTYGTTATWTTSLRAGICIVALKGDGAPPPTNNANMLMLF